MEMVMVHWRGRSGRFCTPIKAVQRYGVSSIQLPVTMDLPRYLELAHLRYFLTPGSDERDQVRLRAGEGIALIPTRFWDSVYVHGHFVPDEAEEIDVGLMLPIFHGASPRLEIAVSHLVRGTGTGDGGWSRVLRTSYRSSVSALFHTLRY